MWDLIKYVKLVFFVKDTSNTKITIRAGNDSTIYGM
jgi:hypothetical protein